MHVSPSAKSADMPRYSPPTARAEFSDQDFIKYCQDRLAGAGSLPYHELVSQYKKIYNLRCYIPSNYFHKRPEHFAQRYKNKSLRISLAATPSQDKSVSTESRLLFTASSRPTTKSLSEQVITKEPVPATLDSPEDVGAKEVDCFGEDESADDDIYILLNKDTPGKE